MASAGPQLGGVFAGLTSAAGGGGSAGGNFGVGQTCQEPSDLAHDEGSVFVVGFTGSPFAAAVAVSTARKACASIERVVCRYQPG
jgi:hypothetical protein